jgi:RNA polymerase sigma-70 factor (ECF subfamily)
MPPPRPDLDEIYQAHSARLVTQVYALTQDLALAEDLVQEAFCRAVARWSRLSAYDDPVGWIRRVAWNLAASNWRRGRRTRSSSPRLLELAVPGPTPDHVVLVQALGTMPPPQRRVLVMFYLADMSLAQIADFEKVSENVVKQRLHRGRASLFAALTEITPEVGRA